MAIELMNYSFFFFFPQNKEDHCMPTKQITSMTVECPFLKKNKYIKEKHIFSLVFESESVAKHAHLLGGSITC